MYNDDDNIEGVEDEDIKRLMKDHMVDEDVAEKAQELMEEWGLDEDEAIEFAEEI